MLSDHLKKNVTQLSKSSDAQALYQEALLSHHKKPCGYNVHVDMTHSMRGDNPACGDEITVNTQIENGKIKALAFTGDSCAICRASASLMCQQLPELDVTQALKLVENISINFAKNIEFTDVFSPLNSIFSLPIRQQCALLPWRTLRKVIDQTNPLNLNKNR